MNSAKADLFFRPSHAVLTRPSRNRKAVKGVASAIADGVCCGCPHASPGCHCHCHCHCMSLFIIVCGCLGDVTCPPSPVLEVTGRGGFPYGWGVMMGVIE